MTHGAGDDPSSSRKEAEGSSNARGQTSGDQDDQFRALVDAIEEYAVFRLDPDGYIVSWNSGAERIKGYQSEEILGEHFSIFYTKEDRVTSAPEENLAAAAEQGSIVDEGWRVRKGGSQFWANVTITAIRNDDGDLEGYAKVTRDMTDRRRAEEERRLHLSVSQSIAEAATLEEGLQVALEDICNYAEWVVGQAWVPTESGDVERVPAAYVQDVAFEQFEEASREFTFEPGEGIPGRAFGSGESVWYEDVTLVTADEYARTTLAADAGLQAGLGVPVIADSEVALVLEFYLAERREEDERLVELVKSVSAELGELVARRQAEDERNRERELLTEVMAAAPVGISVLTAEGDIERMNDRARDLRGNIEPESRTEEVYTFYDEEGRLVPADERPFARVVATGEPVYDWIGQVERPDGDRQWLSVYAAPIEEEGERLDRVVIVEEDITELREQYRAITESINDVIVTIDTESMIRSINPAVDRVFGYTPQELIGASLTELMPAEYREQHRTGIDRYLETGERNLDWDYIELPGRRADGVEISLAVSFSEIQYYGERYFTGVLRDITERKEYQQRLETSNERLEQFAYAASHDLQEPLRMVSSYLQLLENRYRDELDQDAGEFIDYAVDGADRMRAMIDALLEYSRVETKGDPFEAVTLDAVLDDALHDLEVRIDESDAEITTQSLPIVHGDADQLRQVFQNLLANAIEYTGDEPPRVHVSAERKGQLWQIAVTDEGIGIDPSEHERVFDVFERLHTREEHTGTGIGLALCKRIVERHDGEIWIESESGEGVTVSFTLPVVSEHTG